MKALIIGRGRGCNEKADVQFIDLEKISVSYEWFQNRAATFSTRSVEQIIGAVQTNTIRLANMDAITAWKNP
jgi:hypothetical protein